MAKEVYSDFACDFTHYQKKYVKNPMDMGTTIMSCIYCITLEYNFDGFCRSEYNSDFNHVPPCSSKSILSPSLPNTV